MNRSVRLFSKDYWVKAVLNIKYSWSSMVLAKKLGAVTLLLMLLILPLSVMLALSPVKLFSRAGLPITPPISPPMTPPSYSYPYGVGTEPQTVMEGERFKLWWERNTLVLGCSDQDCGKVKYVTIIPEGIVISDQSMPDCFYGRGCVYSGAFPEITSPRDEKNYVINDIYAQRGGDYIFYTDFYNKVGQVIASRKNTLTAISSTVTPINTSIPTPAATIKPSPTPGPNNIPEIITSSLGVVMINRSFSREIYGFDKDNDSLKMIITSLPAGVVNKGCVYSGKWYDLRKGSKITCTISGVVKQVGTFNILFTLSDNRGGQVQKTLPLKVSKGFVIFPRPDETPPPKTPGGYR